jgi:hypothetical protein
MRYDISPQSLHNLLLLRRPNMRSMDFTAKQKTTPRLLPMRLQRAEMQQHKRAGGFARCGCPAERGLEEICEL